MYLRLLLRVGLEAADVVQVAGAQRLEEGLQVLGEDAILYKTIYYTRLYTILDTIDYILYVTLYVILILHTPGPGCRQSSGRPPPTPPRESQATNSQAKNL